MATVNYLWNLPTVGGDEDAWGGQLNANWTALDTLLGGVSQTEFAILDGATVTTAELNLLDGVTATTAELNQLDGNVFTADVLPDADSTRDLGSSSAAWAIAYLDAIEPVGADTTIKRVGGTNATPLVEAIAKVWADLNGTGTIAVRDSLNVSSVTDNGLGNYNYNLTNAMSTASYSIAVSGDAGDAPISSQNAGASKTTSTFRQRLFNSSFSNTDTAHASVGVHGDLA